MSKNLYQHGNMFENAVSYLLQDDDYTYIVYIYTYIYIHTWGLAAMELMSWSALGTSQDTDT